MKWFLCLLLLGVGYVAYTEYQDLDAKNASLKKAEATIADLKRQLQGGQNPTAAAPSVPSYATPAPRPSWMNTASDLDKTPVPAHRR